MKSKRKGCLRSVNIHSHSWTHIASGISPASCTPSRVQRYVHSSSHPRTRIRRQFAQPYSAAVSCPPQATTDQCTENRSIRRAHSFLPVLDTRLFELCGDAAVDDPIDAKIEMKTPRLDLHPELVTDPLIRLLTRRRSLPLPVMVWNLAQIDLEGAQSPCLPLIAAVRSIILVADDEGLVYNLALLLGNGAVECYKVNQHCRSRNKAYATHAV